MNALLTSEPVDVIGISALDQAQKVKLIIRGGLPLCKREVAQEKLFKALWQMPPSISQQGYEMPNFQCLIDSLHHLCSDKPFENAALLKLLQMVPTGESISIGTISLDEVAVYNVIMAEDGHVYGIRYTKVMNTAFCLPHGQLAGFVDLVFNKIAMGLVPELEWQHLAS